MHRLLKVVHLGRDVAAGVKASIPRRGTITAFQSIGSGPAEEARCWLPLDRTTASCFDTAWLVHAESDALLPMPS